MNEWQTLSHLSPEAWAHVLLQQDPLYRRIPAAEVPDCIRRGIQAGLDAAKHWTLDGVYQAIETQNVALCTEPGEGACGIHAEYSSAAISVSGRCEIRLYEKTMQAIVSQAQQHSIPLSLQQVTNLHLAHEFFHYLEDTNQVAASQTEYSVSFRLCYLFRQNRKIQSLHEIAAHLFAQRLCHAEFHPLQLDWLLLRQQDEAQAKAFYDACLRANDLTKGGNP